VTAGSGRRCGTGVPLDQLDPGDRAAVETFRRYLAGEMAPDERAAYERGGPIPDDRSGASSGDR